jgi:hypothetical protein
VLQSSHPGLPSFCDLPHSTWSNLLFSQGSEKICIYRALNFVLFWAVAVVGFALRVGKEGLDAGTKLVPETVPRPVAQVGVGLVGVFIVTYFLRYLFTTALFILVCFLSLPRVE